MTSLRFIGDWHLAIGLSAGIILSLFVWLYYFRETKNRSDYYKWLLPTLRSLAVLLIILMLTGPVLHHKWIVGQLARIMIFIDSSQSMGINDTAMSSGRKLLIAKQLKLLSPELFPEDLISSQMAINQSRAYLLEVSNAKENIEELLTKVSQEIEKSYESFKNVEFEPGMFVNPDKGSILYEFWKGAKGSDLNAIKNIEGYPDEPDGAIEVKNAIGKIDWADNYASRLSGYVYPPVSGEYVFYIVSDDQSWLFISSDDNPDNKYQIANLKSYTPVTSWDQNPTQRSKPISLEAGKRYYIEGLHIEQTGGDHIGIGWKMPDGSLSQPISGEYLSPVQKSSSQQVYLSSRDHALLQYENELVKLAAKLIDVSRGKDDKQFDEQYRMLMINTDKWRKHLQLVYEAWAQKLAQSGSEDIRQAIERIDKMTRQERIKALLLNSDQSLLIELANNHNIDLLTFSYSETKHLLSYQAGEIDDTAESLLGLDFDADSEATNIGSALKEALMQGQANTSDGSNNDQINKLAVVVFSDGIHNYGQSPVYLAKICGGREIPVYTVGTGSLKNPGDLAVGGVEIPNSVYYKDRAKGKIAIKDNLEAGKGYVLKIVNENETVWQEQMISTGSGIILKDFDFPIDKLLKEKLAGKKKQVSYQSFPLTFEAVIEKIEGIDTEPANNNYYFHTQSTFQKNKILVLDGRPRWEYRYIRNLLGRDEKWEVTAIAADPSEPGGGITRGKGQEKFPDSKQELMLYDLIIIGDMPSDVLESQELEWISEAVEKRGTGLIFIDGLRKHLAGYKETALGKLIPVEWISDQPIQNPSALRLTEKGVLKLTEQGVDTSALLLSIGGKTNEEIWSSFDPPHWISSVKTLAGAEIIVEAQLKDKTIPAVVFRRSGAGNVLFSAFDETWRWRYRVADEYHQRYWNQIGNMIMAQPFAVSDRFVSLDAGPLIYTPGQTAGIRAKVRDTEGNYVYDAIVKAQIIKDGKAAASIPLEIDTDSGVYSGVTAGLLKGRYEVKLDVMGYPADQLMALANFFVQPPNTGEMSVLKCDEGLLEQIASVSGGQYFREEQANVLKDQLDKLSEGKVVQSDTALWQSWPWFGVLIMLLTVEWICRKRAGMM